MVPERITSAQNPKIKDLLALQEKSRLRRERGIFVVEGRRELEHCIEAGFVIDTLFVCPEIAGHDWHEVGQAWREVRGADSLAPFGECSPHLSASHDRHKSDSAGIQGVSPKGELPEGEPSKLRQPKIFYLSEELYDKVAYRGGTEGIIAEVRTRTLTLEDLKLSENPLIVVLESVEKPGNLGAVIRSADAAGADAVIVCDPLTDLYNPNLIRSSIGGVFTTQCVAVSSEEAIAWLKSHDIKILTAQLQDSVPYYDRDMRCGTAIVIGTESTGLTDAWRKAADAHVLIPMLGKLDSLNASVSAAILLYEAVRQRRNG